MGQTRVKCWSDDLACGAGEVLPASHTHGSGRWLRKRSVHPQGKRGPHNRANPGRCTRGRGEPLGFPFWL